MDVEEHEAVAPMWELVDIMACAILRTTEVSGSRERIANRLLVRRSFSFVTMNLNNCEFTRAFRMSKTSFKNLSCLLQPHLFCNEGKGMRSSSGSIEIGIQVAGFLRTLAGAQHCDIMICFGISRPTAYQCLKRVCQAVILCLPLPGILRREADRVRVAAEFSSSRVARNPLVWCCGALDGIAIPNDKPRGVTDPAQYWNRKGYYALPVQAVVDGKYRFLYMSAVCVGSTYDSLAFSRSSLASELANGLLPEPFYIVDDDAYNALDYLLTPISPRLAGPNSPEDAYNFFQSSLRMHVEQAFGQLMARWRLLGMSLKYSIHLNGAIFQAAMALHNFCIK